MTRTPGGVDPADWITIWQSEMAAMAVDREIHEGLAASALAWNAALVARTDGPPGLPGADAPPGSAPARDAPGAREHERARPGGG